MSEGWFSRLKQGLSKSSTQLGQGLTGIFTKRKLDSETLEELEELLIRADLGVENAAEIAAELGRDRFDKTIAPSEIRSLLAREIARRLEPQARAFEIDRRCRPMVVLVTGVNGSGKTTTLGKLALRLKRQGFKVLLAAGDTFRAAAVEQLKIWGQRAEVEVIAGAAGADAAALAFEAHEHARIMNADVLLIDTAGRLQNKAGLMAELEKIRRVLQKRDPGAPHASLLVLDAGVGQNALSQVQAFQEAAGITGLVMTKLDGTAKGGILVALARRFGLPIHFIGVGEGAEDLQDFNAQAFAAALVGQDRP